MAILAQYGTIKFYENRDYVHHEITQNQEIMVVFDKSKVPAFQFMVDDDVASVSISVVRYSSDASVYDTTMATTDMTTYTRIKYNGTTVSGTIEDGWYYIKIVSGSNTYYSDVFFWKTSSAEKLEMLKITTSTYDFAIGRDQEYRFSTSNQQYECYLLVNQYDGINIQNEEDATEENGQILPYYTGFSRVRQFKIEGHESIYEYLVGLRVMEINGSVTVQFRGNTYSARDISVEVENQNGDFDIVFINIKFVANNDIITPINE